MRVLVNVGLVRNTEGFLRGSDVAGAFDDEGFEIVDSRITLAQGVNDEDTWIGLIETGRGMVASFATIAAISKRLDQDCIAVANPDHPDCGKLIGPKAKDWGEFNPDYFKVL